MPVIQLPCIRTEYAGSVQSLIRIEYVGRVLSLTHQHVGEENGHQNDEDQPEYHRDGRKRNITVHVPLSIW